jgi:hypothetical protein
MKGDFSNWRFNPHGNDQGLLFQQGRVTLDADLTEAGLIELNWRTQAGRDVIGAGVAAVPAGEADGWRVTAAAVQGNAVHVSLQPGRIWADGQLLYLPGVIAVDRVASYLPPPANPAGTAIADIGDDVRDAVILEISLEELNGFQVPDRLIEPALGGPDTAERINLLSSLRLLRLGNEETCANIGARLADPAGGRLTVSLTPPQASAEPCPVVSSGGYTGFEHNLYRIEIAATGSGVPHFKWSRFNGGLVGRGEFRIDGSLRRVVLGANRAAIVNSGLTGFYLEAVQYDAALGHWQVTYGTPATLNGDQDLELVHPPTFGVFPSVAAGATVFFRLWDGLGRIADFSNAANPVHLNDGIHLTFNAASSYRPGDYWTFAVRAGEIANPQLLVDNRVADGPQYRRVALAEINWTAARDTSVSGSIEDCRLRFNPLVRQKVCCTLLVGDGLTSFGDFNSLEQAALHLPAEGGELCLLPGTHYANLTLNDRKNIRIKGCPHRTWLLARPEMPAATILSFSNCSDIHVSGIDLISFSGSAIVADADEKSGARDFSVSDCRILAHAECIHVHGLNDVHIANNRVWLMDTEHGRAAISLRVKDALAERNRVGVWPWTAQPPANDDGEADDEEPTTPDDPCVDPGELYDNMPWVMGYVVGIWTGVYVAQPAQPYRAWGGIHLRGGCESVRLLENHVDGGAGHGITLGGVMPDELTDADGGINPSVTLTDRNLSGYVQDEAGQGISGIDVYLSRNGSVTEQATSGDLGRLSFSGIPALTYSVSVEAGYEIVELREASINVTGANQIYYVLVVRPAKLEVPEDRAYLQRIAIDGNEVERMALSGIGFLPYTLIPETPELPKSFDKLDDQIVWFSYLMAPRELVGSCNVVSDLGIHGNRLHHNLLAVFGDVMRKSVHSVGQGGISLGLVESTVIADNLIHDNGTSATNPTCGIFVGYAEALEICGNRISGNGPLDKEYDSARLTGIRSGVYVRLASALLIGGESDGYQKPALRLADNVIDQPAGRALTAYAFGPVACDNNHFNSEREGRLDLIDSLVGTVLIINLGGIHRQMQFNTEKGDPADAQDAQASVGNIAGNAQFDVPTVESLLPGGEVLFNSNQSRMGPSNRAFLSQLIFTLDDLGYDANHSAVFRQDLLFGNVAAFALSLRASDNRFRERTRCCALSLWTHAFGITNDARALTMNTTAHNQADHCIFALSNGGASALPVVNERNLVLVRQLCARVSKQWLNCQEAEKEDTLGYIGTAFVQSYLNETAAGLLDSASDESATLALNGSMKGITDLNVAYRQSAQQEAYRVQQRYGSDSPRARRMQAQLRRNGESLAQLKIQTGLTAMKEKKTNIDALEGRVADQQGKGQAGLVVELVRADGSSLFITANTDADGSYTIPLSTKTKQRLQDEREGVFVKVLSNDGKTLLQDKQAIRVGTRIVTVLSDAAVPPR